MRSFNIRKVENILEYTSYIILAIFWIITIIGLITFPDIIPVHFNSKGKPYCYGHKLNFITFPLIGTSLFISLNILRRKSYLFNYLAPVSKQNNKAHISMAPFIIRYVKAGFMIIFLFIILNSYLNVIYKSEVFSCWLLPVIFILVFIPLIFYILKLYKK